MPPNRPFSQLPHLSQTGGLSACERGNQWQCALEMWKELVPSSCQADIITFSTTISALDLYLDLGDAEDEMLSLGVLSQCVE